VSPATGIETERKFALAKGQQLPDLEALAVVGDLEHRELVSVYYDTPTFRLNAARQIIRRRSGGPDAGWQAKLPTDNPDERWEVQLPPGGQRMPRELRDLVAATVGEEPLFPVAELRTHRALRELRSPDGTVMAVVSADQVTASVSGQSQEWTEAEVELVEGDPSLLDAVEAAFRSAGILRSPSRSKLAQAIAGQLTRIEEPPEGRNAAQVVAAYVGTQVGLLQALEVSVVRNDFDAVHRCRVATRRLRSTLRTFERTYRPASVRALREELRWHAEQLGAPRDAEVLRDRLATTLTSLPSPDAAEAAEILRWLDDQHVRAHQTLVAGLVTDRYRHLQLALEQLMAAPPLGRMADEPAEVLLPQMLDEAVERARRLAVRATVRPTDLTRWHELRKAAKAVRYGAEALRPILGESAVRQAATWARVCTELGEVQDTVICQQVISDLAWSAVGKGHSRRPFDDLRSYQDRLQRDALARARAAVDAALA
jgi:CHAD domain-containing protein